jgi:hypothetical protein
MVKATLRPIDPPEIRTAPIVQKAGRAPGFVWNGTENLSPSGSWSPAHQPRNYLLVCAGYITYDWFGILMKSDEQSFISLYVYLQ